MTTLYNRRLEDVAIFKFKIKHSMFPSSVTELFNSSHTNYNLRNADFRQECFNTTKYGIHSLRHFGPPLGPKLTVRLDQHLHSVTLKKASERQRLPC